MLLSTLGARLLGNIPAGKRINKKVWGTKRADEGIVRADYGNKINKMDFQLRLIL